MGEGDPRLPALGHDLLVTRLEDPQVDGEEILGVVDAQLTLVRGEDRIAEGDLEDLLPDRSYLVGPDSPLVPPAVLGKIRRPVRHDREVRGETTDGKAVISADTEAVISAGNGVHVPGTGR